MTKHFARVVLVLGEDTFLLIHTTKGRNRWEFPGGKISAGEEPMQAARRELQEETGILAEELVPIYDTKNLSLDGEDWIGHFYKATKWVGTPRVMEPGRADDIDWFTIPEMNQLPTIACLSIEVAKKVRMPKVVCLCGSTRFWKQFSEHGLRLTLEGCIVLSIGIAAPDAITLAHDPILSVTKTKLDELHKRKIDLCDEVFVLNVGGYIGPSTRSEIDYAVAHDKPVKYLESSVLVKDFSLSKEKV